MVLYETIRGRWYLFVLQCLIFRRYFLVKEIISIFADADRIAEARSLG